MKRRYNQFCGVSKALDLVGERWTLLIVRDLLMGPSKFGELLARLDGITTNLLAKRLKEMRALGLLALVEPDLKGSPYALTEKGRDLEPVVFALGAWGAKHAMDPAPSDKPNLRWALLSVRRRLAPLGQDWAINATANGVSYCLFERSNKVGAEAGRSVSPDVEVLGPENLLCRGFARGELAALEDGVVKISGQLRLLKKVFKGLS